jgi:hypothetical protein
LGHFQRNHTAKRAATEKIRPAWLMLT